MGSKRSTNFLSKEIEDLLRLVEKNKNIIECKKTDRTTSEDKMRCWMKIGTQFNADSDCYRSHETLKMKYENLKRDAKRNYASDKQSMYKTGGGPKPPSKVTTMDEQISNIVLEEQIKGHQSVYDDDKLETEIVEILEDNTTENPIITDESNVFENTPNITEGNKWKNYSPKMLKTQKHQSLNIGDKRKSSDVLWAKVAETKIKKIEIETEEAQLRKTKLELEIIELHQKIKKGKIELEILELEQKRIKQSEKSFVNERAFPKEF